MPQTKEDRIRIHAKALPKQVCCRKHWVSMNYHVWMPLARHWKIPIRILKKIVKENATEEEAWNNC